MEKAFKIIETDLSKSSLVRKILLIVWTIMFVTMLVFTFSKDSFELFLVMIAPSILIVIYIPNFIGKYNTKGKLILSNDKIVLKEKPETNEISINEIDKLTILFRSSFGDMTTASIILGTELSSFSNGAGNFLIIEQGEKKIQCEFLSKSSVDLMHLKKLVKSYVDNGVDAELTEYKK